MSSKTILLIIAGLLIFVGLTKPDFSFPVKPVVNPVVVVEPPSDPELKKACQGVIDSLKAGGSSRKTDAVRLSSLYMDLASLIEIDGEDQIVKNTEEIREANRLSGLLLRMNIKGKYPDLATKANDVVVLGIGDDSVELDSTLRKTAVETFRALGWACYEGAK
jgi:hypothetical protein